MREAEERYLRDNTFIKPSIYGYAVGALYNTALDRAEASAHNREELAANLRYVNGMFRPLFEYQPRDQSRSSEMARTVRSGLIVERAVRKVLEGAGYSTRAPTLKMEANGVDLVIPVDVDGDTQYGLAQIKSVYLPNELSDMGIRVFETPTEITQLADMHFLDESYNRYDNTTTPHGRVINSCQKLLRYSTEFENATPMLIIVPSPDSPHSWINMELGTVVGDPKDLRKRHEAVDSVLYKIFFERGKK